MKDPVGMVELFRRCQAFGADESAAGGAFRIAAHAHHSAGVIHVDEHLANAMATTARCAYHPFTIHPVPSELAPGEGWY
jgi:arginase family enzyme